MCMAMELKSVLLCVHVETNYTLKTHLMAHYLVNLSSLKGYNGQSSVFFINSAEICKQNQLIGQKKGSDGKMCIIFQMCMAIK